YRCRDRQRARHPERRQRSIDPFATALPPPGGGGAAARGRRNIPANGVSAPRRGAESDCCLDFSLRKRRDAVQSPRPAPAVNTSKTGSSSLIRAFFLTGSRHI